MILKLRVTSLIAIHILILLHVYYFGSDVVGSIDFQEFFHSFIKLGVINAGVILVFLAFATTLIFGRFFCGWACHFGAIQELSYYILKKLNINTITINSKLVTILPFIILLNYYVIPNFYHSLQNPWQISISLNEPEIWKFLPGFIIGLLTFIIDGFLIVYFLGKKGFCRFLCPWGAFLKIPNSLAFFKVRKTGICTECHVCTEQCPVGIDVSYEINNYNKVTNTNCTSCLNCTTGCPSNALSYKFENPLTENINLKNYFYNPDMYKHNNISKKFLNIRSQDFSFLMLTILLSFSVDSLYGIGHFLAYGIGILLSYIMIFSLKKFTKLFKIAFISIISFLTIINIIIKFSIWNGDRYYDLTYSKNIDFNEQIIYSKKSIKNLERASMLYLIKNSKRHIKIAQLYLTNNNKDRALEHANIAKSISPNNNAPEKLLEFIINNN